MIFPMFAMVVLTLMVAVNMLRSRIKAVRSKAVPIKYFRAMAGAGVDVPEYAAVPSRHFSNLFELPVLFYAACLAAMVMQVIGPVMVGLAWAFVFCRVVQAIIHLTYNNILHRMAAYFAGFGVLLVMWTLLAIRAA